MRFALAVAAVVTLALGLTGACARRGMAVRDAPPSLPPPAASEAPGPPVSTAPASPDDAFTGEVKPLLARRCEPCHVPGGQMYERLPFDDPVTVRENTAGILRRLKAPEERAIVERWLGTFGEPANR